MKPAPFDYARPHSLAEATALLAGPDAQVLAGGQTLIPMLNMRLARPRLLVDIAHLPGLSGIELREGALWIGAMTRQAAALASPLIAAHAPLLARALGHVGHAPTRARGTIGGSLANADPAAEVPLALTALDAMVEIAGAEGAAEMPVRDFITGPMSTELPPGALVTGLRLPAMPARQGSGFAEIAPRPGDYAVLSAAVRIAADASGRPTAIAAGIGGAVDRPTMVDLSPLMVTGLTADDIASAVEAALARIDFAPGPHVSEAYCRRAAHHLLGQALAQARDDLS